MEWKLSYEAQCDTSSFPLDLVCDTVHIPVKFWIFFYLLTSRKKLTRYGSCFNFAHTIQRNWISSFSVGVARTSPHSLINFCHIKWTIKIESYCFSRNNRLNYFSIYTQLCTSIDWNICSGFRLLWTSFLYYLWLALQWQSKALIISTLKKTH